MTEPASSRPPAHPPARRAGRRPVLAGLALGLALGLAFGLGGCSGLLAGPGAPPQLYTLTPQDSFPPNLPSVPWQLLVETPLAPAALDTERIALTRSPTTVDYFAGAAWTDRAPPMIQTLVLESLENTGKIPAVGRDSLSLRADYSLKLELRHFEAEYAAGDTAPLIRIRLNGKLVKLPDRAIVAQRTFEATARAAANDIPVIVVGFNAALHDALGQLVAWTLTAATQP